jgi:hypothetical protein
MVTGYCYRLQVIGTRQESTRTEAKAKGSNNPHVIGYRHRLSVLGHRLLVIGYGSPLTGYRLWLPVTGYRLPVVDYRLTITGYGLPVMGVTWVIDKNQQ